MLEYVSRSARRTANYAKDVYWGLLQTSFLAGGSIALVAALPDMTAEKALAGGVSLIVVSGAIGMVEKYFLRGPPKSSTEYVTSNRMIDPDGTINLSRKDYRFLDK